MAGQQTPSPQPRPQSWQQLALVSGLGRQNASPEQSPSPQLPQSSQQLSTVSPCPSSQPLSPQVGQKQVSPSLARPRQSTARTR